jgi:hypothetical protein
MTHSVQQPKELELLKQLIGEWSVGIAMKTSNDRIVSGCGEMTAVEIRDVGINSEIDTHIEGYEDYYENDVWSFDEPSGKVHLFSITSEGDVHDHVGNWNDNNILELNWRGTFEDQELEEKIIAKWLSKDQVEIKEIHSVLSKIVLTIDYVFKRKEV